MADVVQIAQQRRKALAAELAKLEEFIQTAEALLKWHESQSHRAFDAAGAKGTGSVEPMMPRTAAVAATSTGAT